MRIKAIVAAVVVGVLALAGCGSTAGGSSQKSVIRISGFSVLGAANKPVIKGFQDTPEGKGVEFQTSYGASGDQSRAVDAGAKADIVHYSLESDVTRLVKDKLVADNWKDNATKGIATSSVVVIVVRKGNPKHITGWDDLIKPGVQIITPNPGSSGSARWNILAAWAHIIGNGGTEAQAKAYLTKLLNNTIALPSSGREATTAFTGGSGDVLLSYENEAIEARQSGADVDYIVPSDTLKIENPAAVTVGASPKAKDFLKFMTSAAGQKLYAQAGFRPVINGVDVGQVQGANDPSNPFPTPQKLFTIDKTFGGWSVAGDKYFGDGEDGDPLGIITELQKTTGKVGSN
jgi:sulfate/thiosulfate transport system substrate-binding protein